VAKAREIPGLHAGVPFAEAAARTVAVRAAELREHADGVLDTSDIERVHAMRVATRRLRAVLEIYAPCFPPKQLKPVLRDVKALADALGARRDPDVQLEALDRLADAFDPADRDGVARLAGEVRAEQRAGNEVLAAALARAEADDLDARLRALVEAAR
jgi:CHAD domain-containing protein